MSIFRRKTDTPAESEVEPFSRWSILTHLDSGPTMTLSGYVYDGMDLAELLRYIDGAAEGLRSAGFDAEVTLTREAQVTR